MNALPVKDMANSFIEHAIVINNFVTMIGHQLKSSLCRVFGDGVKYKWMENQNKPVIPDVSINCNIKNRRSTNFLGVPRFIMEVLSDATEQYDRKEKMELYKKVEVAEYWLVDWRKKQIEIYVLSPDEASVDEADVFNQFLYHGKQKIMPERLAEIDTAEIAVPYGADHAPVPEQRYRDIAKMLMAMTDGAAAYCILAVENESKINYAMPVKDGLYDFLQLARQVAAAAKSHRKAAKKGLSADEFLSGFWKGDRLLPVVTLVVYFGADEWDGPLSLREMYAECDEEILNHAADYHINLTAPCRLSDDEIDEFQTDLREVLRYIKYSRDGKKLCEVVNGDERFKSMERQAAEVIRVVTGSNIKYPEGKERVDMCLALQQIREEGEIMGAIRTYRKMGVSQEDARGYLMDEYKKNAEKIQELLKMYWK